MAKRKRTTKPASSDRAQVPLNQRLEAETRSAETNWATGLSNAHDLENPDHERKWSQRAAEIARRQAKIKSFVEEQRLKREWLSFAEIADSFARRDNLVLANEDARLGALDLLCQDLLAGEFEEDGKSRIRFLHPGHQTEEMTRQRMSDVECDKSISLPDVIDLFQPDVVRSEYLMYCWMPHQTLCRWFAKYGLQVPPHFTKESERPAYDGKAKLAAQTSRSNARRRGRRPDKIERAKEAMRRDINEGKLTIDDLKAILEKNLPERYGVSRTTARDARKVVLSEFVENSNPANDI
jgi:hypothetical protein